MVSSEEMGVYPPSSTGSGGGLLHSLSMIVLGFWFHFAVLFLLPISWRKREKFLCQTESPFSSLAISFLYHPTHCNPTFASVTYVT